LHARGKITCKLDDPINKLTKPLSKERVTNVVELIDRIAFTTLLLEQRGVSVQQPGSGRQVHGKISISLQSNCAFQDGQILTDEEMSNKNGLNK
jgi:hypothetical protein